MAAKLLLILVVAVLSVALAMPSAKLMKAEPKEEAMQSAETIHLGIGIGAGYGHPGYGYRGGLLGGYGYGAPYYGPFDYTGFLPHFMHHHY